MSRKSPSVSELTKKAKQQRRHPRYSYDAPAMICRPLGAARAGWIHNVSEGGVMVELSEPFPPGTPLDVFISLAGKSIRAEATVVWSQNSDDQPHPSYRHGLVFTTIQQQDQLHLEHFITEVLRR
ncbi:MAG: PilZ domain-containing protein [Candidatus Methylomirabilales bacterium]